MPELEADVLPSSLDAIQELGKNHTVWWQWIHKQPFWKMSILSHYKVEINYHIYKAEGQLYPPTKDRPRTWTNDTNMAPYTNKKMKTNPRCKFKHNKTDKTITCCECKFSSPVEIYLVFAHNRFKSSVQYYWHSCSTALLFTSLAAEVDITGAT